MTTKKTTTRRNRGGANGHEPREVVDARADQAWELFAAGRTQREIAEVLGISQPAVSKILRRRATALANDDQDEDRVVAQLLARSEYLFREAIKGYERSQQEQTRKRQREITDGDGNAVSNVREAEVLSTFGDPRFLDQAGRALDRKARLRGVHPRGGRTRSRPDEDPDAARLRLARGLDRLVAAARRVPPDAE